MRFLFDENLPWQVAEALRVLGIKVSYVGRKQDRSPARGSSDEAIYAHAKRTNQIVVTSNHDMILLCIGKGGFVIWIDPYGRQIKRNEMVMLVFGAIPEWERRLAEVSVPIVIRSLRTKTQVLELDKAEHLVRLRMKRRVLRARSRVRPKARPGGSLFL